jgi:hypothetical protein
MNGNIRGRRNWTFSMTVALLVAAVSVVIGYMGTRETVATERFYLRSSAGNVLFDHGRHNEMTESCAACHHDLFAAAQATSCSTCHDDEFEPADFDHTELKEFHGRDCATCHEQTTGDEQAASCRSCHPGIQQSETRTVSCSDCHDDSYAADMIGHDEYQEIEDHSCLGCHSPASVSEVYHANCTSCHLDTAADRFTNSDGSVMCSGCHLR